MRKLYVRILALPLCLAMLACSKNSEPAEYVFTASMSDQYDVQTASSAQADAKTYFSGDDGMGKDVLWSSGDKIKINGTEFTLLSGQGTKNAKFSGPALTDKTVPYQAIYPSSICTGYNKITLPSVQTFNGNVSGFPMYAKSNDQNLSFKNVCGVLTLSFSLTDPEATVAYVDLSADQSMSGNATIDKDSFKAVIDAGQALSGVRINYSASHVNGNPYKLRVYLPEGDYTNLKIKICSDSDPTKSFSCLKTSKKAIVIKRNLETTITLSGLEYQEYAGHKFVYLGTSDGVKWATANVGASEPYLGGDYFAWGATSTYYSSLNPAIIWKAGKESGYILDNAPYYNTSSKAYTKYGKGGLLDSSDDVATVQWGGNWRMPSSGELTNLMNDCYWLWVNSYNGHGAGVMIFKSKAAADKGQFVISGGSAPSGLAYTYSDTHIFFPAEGLFEATKIGMKGTAYIISANVTTEDVTCVDRFYVQSTKRDRGMMDRYYGLNVRPVFK